MKQSRTTAIAVILRYIFLLPLMACVTVLTSCDVHEWPKEPERELFSINIVFETDLPQWEQIHGDYIGRSSIVPVTRGMRDYGTMRYIVRVFPIVDGQPLKSYSDEFVFTRDVIGGYDCNAVINLEPGDYRVMVWSDLSENIEGQSFHNTDNFGEITLQGEHAANTDYRDAFRGVTDITVNSFIDEHEPESCTITMQRPLAKFEFVTNDLREFFEKEASRVARRSGESKDNTTQSAASESRVSLNDYDVVFSYVGYMPCAYSIFTDRPVDSKTGVFFKSKLSRLSDDEASLGFDYVFVNGSQTSVAVQIALYSSDGTQVSQTEPITVPLKRSNHTIISGSFLLTQASGGMGIDPGYNGDFNFFM